MATLVTPWHLAVLGFRLAAVWIGMGALYSLIGVVWLALAMFPGPAWFGVQCLVVALEVAAAVVLWRFSHRLATLTFQQSFQRAEAAIAFPVADEAGTSDALPLPTAESTDRPLSLDDWLVIGLVLIGIVVLLGSLPRAIDFLYEMRWGAPETIYWTALDFFDGRPDWMFSLLLLVAKVLVPVVMIVWPRKLVAFWNRIHRFPRASDSNPCEDDAAAAHDTSDTAD